MLKADKLHVALLLRDQCLRRRRLTIHLTLRARCKRRGATAKLTTTRPYQHKVTSHLPIHGPKHLQSGCQVVTITTGPVRGPPLASEETNQAASLARPFWEASLPCVTERDYPVCEALVSSSASRDTFRAEVVRIEVVSSGAHRSAARGYESILDLEQRPRE